MIYLKKRDRIKQLYLKYFKTEIYCIENNFFVDNRSDKMWEYSKNSLVIYYLQEKKIINFRTVDSLYGHFYEDETFTFKEIRKYFRLATPLEIDIIQAKDLLRR